MRYTIHIWAGIFGGIAAATGTLATLWPDHAPTPPTVCFVFAGVLLGGLVGKIGADLDRK